MSCRTLISKQHKISKSLAFFRGPQAETGAAARKGNQQGS